MQQDGDLEFLGPFVFRTHEGMGTVPRGCYVGRDGSLSASR